MIVCLDNQNGMLFNRRRQSRDRAVIADILQDTANSTIYISDFSRDIFPEAAVCTSCPENAQEDAVYFVEDRSLKPALPYITKITVYRWNRDYPGDFYLDIDPLEAGFRLQTQTDFPGHSHETITKEVYVR
ncbi:MAG: hypothetical protein IKU26_05225 [Clostridia bacterium]|nr:hypothetical protein [Clostridia bacterium]